MSDAEDPPSNESLQFQKLTPEERKQQVNEWREELFEVEYEIDQLTQQLAIKNRQAIYLKRKLGYSAWAELKDDINHVLEFVKSNTVYKKTEDILKSTSTAASSLYGSVSERFINVFH